MVDFFQMNDQLWSETCKAICGNLKCIWLISVYFCNAAKDVEKLKEQQFDKECHLRDLVSQAELLTTQQQKLKHELNASVVSVGLLSADVNRLTEEISVYLPSNIHLVCLTLSVERALPYFREATIWKWPLVRIMHIPMYWQLRGPLWGSC